MSELQKLAEMGDVATGAAVGGGVGAAGGLLVTLLQAKPSLKKGLKNILIGSASGAAVGGGTMALKRISEDTEQPKGEKPQAAPATPEPSRLARISQTPEERASQTMNPLDAAAHGLLPGVGPALDGHASGGANQALRSGGRSLLEGFGGSSLGLGLQLLLAKKGIKTPKGLLQSAGALGGSVHGAMAAASNFNEREKTANAADIGRSIDQAAGNLGNFNVAPFANTGGAAVGGAAGAAVGGGAGLLKALFDNEDDGLLSTLSKALSGGALGGLAGAGLGVGASHLLRNNILDKSSLVSLSGERGRHVADQALRRFVVPGKSIAEYIGSGDKNRLGKDVTDANARETVLQALAPAFVASASPKYRGGWDGRDETKGLLR